MHNTEKTFTYIGIAAIALLLFGLVGWYFFISRQTQDLESADLARGFNVGIPSFSGSRGSTAENIAAGFGLTLDMPFVPKEGSSPTIPRLWRVNTTPIAGMGFVENDSTTLIRYVERSTGHVFDANPVTGEVVRRTNRLIPKVYEAFIGKNDHLILRSFENDVRTTFVGQLGTTTVEGFVSLLGTDLGSNVSDITFTDTGLAFLAAESGVPSLITAELDGTRPVRFPGLSAGDFNIISLPGKRILVERPGSGILGGAFEVRGESLVPLVRAIPGLTLAVREGTSELLIGADTGKNIYLSARGTPEERGISIPLQTTAEKCVWSRGEGNMAYCAVPQTPPPPEFLNKWHQGRFHTVDSWFAVETNSGTSTELYAMSPSDGIDVERPIVDTTNTYLAFMNARDKSLWVLRIKE